MSHLIAERIKHVPRSFIREILKVASDPRVISFAGGLPNPDYFPVAEIEKSCSEVLRQNGREALQYSSTEGFFPLREKIARYYHHKKNLQINPADILITNGSQQALDLIGKTLINENDPVIMEEPGYLGAIQAFSIYRPRFASVPLEQDGVRISALKKVLEQNRAKVFYTVPNFQNPSGITYSLENRRALGQALSGSGCLVIEDDPYGELRFLGESQPSLKTFYEPTLLLGSFSKTVIPSFRLGWMVASPEIMDKLVVAKQAADLHTAFFSQRVIDHYLAHNDLDLHLTQICQAYKNQRDLMVGMMEKHFPDGVSFTRPEGGMFVWASLPEGLSSMELFQRVIEKNVAFVPGSPFYINGGGESTLRLNYSNSSEAAIEKGIEILGQAIKGLSREKFPLF